MEPRGQVIIPLTLTHLVIECGAAGITSLLHHGRNEGPLVGLGSVALGGVESNVPVEAAHGIDVSVQQRDTDVAAAEIHGCHIVPRARAQVKLAHAVEVLHPVKAAEAVDTTVDDRSAVVGTRLQIVFHVDPDVRVKVIRLDAVAGTSSAPAANSQ